MDAADISHRNGEHPERVRLAQVRLGGEGQLPHILEGADVGGRDSRLVELPSVQCDILVGVPHRPLKPLKLQGLQCASCQQLGAGPVGGELGGIQNSRP
jgi:hypothetical protein